VPQRLALWRLSAYCNGLDMLIFIWFTVNRFASESLTFFHDEKSKQKNLVPLEIAKSHFFNT